jgi:hypothetical protein
VTPAATPTPDPTPDVTPDPTPTPIPAAIHEPTPIATLPAVEPATESASNSSSADLVMAPPSPDPGSPLRQPDPGQAVGAVLGDMANRVTNVVEPGAADAAVVANTFGFPLLLMAAVLFFLIVRRRRNNRGQER